MATRLYFRRDDGGGDSLAAGVTGWTDRSTALPSGTDLSANWATSPQNNTRFSTTASTSIGAIWGSVTGAQTAAQCGRINNCEITGILAGSIAANTWTASFTGNETNTNANAFLAFSLYILQSDLTTVRGRVYDSATALGTEFATSTGLLTYSFSGSAVAGVLSSDYLVLETWYVATQAMATAYNVNLNYGGNVDQAVTGTTADPKSYLETPQDLFTAPPSGSLIYADRRIARNALLRR